MGLLEKEIGELRRLLSLLDHKKITLDELHGRIEVYGQIERRAKLMINAYSLALKNGKLLGRIVKSNIIGDMAAIDIGDDYQLEKVKCSLEEGKIIIRQECLDLSGQKKNYDVCKECASFIITRQLLLEER